MTLVQKIVLAVVLVGPVKYRSKLIYVLNLIGLFFYLLFLFSQYACTRREFTGGNSKPIVNKNLNYKIKLDYKHLLIKTVPSYVELRRER